MNDPRRYANAPVLGAVLLVSVALAAMFSRPLLPAAPSARDRAPWLGASLEAGQAAVPPVPGARIKSVWSCSPAFSAGLAPGDILLRVNGIPVETPAEVQAVISGLKSPARVELTVQRGRRLMVVPAVLRERPNFARNIGVVLAILVTVFTLLYATALNRVAVVGCGAVLAVVLGTWLGFYTEESAFAAVRMGPLALLLGLGLLVAGLEQTGFFEMLAHKIGKLAQGDWRRMMVLLCIATFFLSAFVNNLTTVLVILPITLRMTTQLGFDPRPFVVAEIVSSNLGGASCMIGDFPNMLIASETGLQFHEFLLYMMPPCLILLVVTIAYMKYTRGGFQVENHDRMVPACEGAHSAGEMHPAQGKARATRGEVLAVSSLVIAALLFCGRLGLPPATVTMAGGVVVLLLCSRAAPELLQKAGFADILFFACLFVLVGGAEASGLLDILGVALLSLSGGSILWFALLLMWGAAIVTAFLNAGPTAALFVPIVLGLGNSGPHGMFWWALSLGVCAGSSATVVGATAGPIALTKLREFLERTTAATGSPSPATLTFAAYARSGVPLMLMFLVLSSAYVAMLSL